MKLQNIRLKLLRWVLDIEFEWSRKDFCQFDEADSRLRHFQSVAADGRSQVGASCPKLSLISPISLQFSFIIPFVKFFSKFEVSRPKKIFSNSEMGIVFKNSPEINSHFQLNFHPQNSPIESTRTSRANLSIHTRKILSKMVNSPLKKNSS